MILQQSRSFTDSDGERSRQRPAPANAAAEEYFRRGLKQPDREVLLSMDTFGLIETRFTEASFTRALIIFVP